MNFQILIFDGFDELDAIAPYEVLQNASSAGAIVELSALDATKQIVAAHGLRVMPSAQLDLKQRPDVLIVPGGGWMRGSSKGARAEVERGAIPAALKSLHQSGTIVAAVCTGAMLLASSGILRGRPATTHHSAIKDLENFGAEIINERVVDDGDIVTAGGVTSGLDLALWLVERFYGSKVARQIGTQMEYEHRGNVWRRPN